MNALPDTPPAISPDKVVWMFGTRRTGSTWLGFMLRDLPGGHKWGEPLIGELIGGFHERFADRKSKNHIFSPEYRDLWLSWVRRLTCEGAAARSPSLVDDEGFIVIRDPHGTVGAPLLCEALPESKLLILIRDPRDVVASMVDAHQSGGWMGARAEKQGRAQRREGAHPAERDPDRFAKSRARRIIEEFEKAGEAYAIHKGPKTLVRYEDVRFNTEAEVTRICGDLELPGTADDIRRVVDEHAWENVPEEEKGSGKFHRKASPGSWREDLTKKQIQMIERLCEPVLDRYYEGWREEQSAAR